MFSSEIINSHETHLKELFDTIERHGAVDGKAREDLWLNFKGRFSLETGYAPSVSLHSGLSMPLSA